MLSTTFALLAAVAVTTGDSLPPWVAVDPATQTVTLTLEVARPAGAASAHINGEHDGSVQVVVPRGWTVQWRWKNLDESAPHSLVVMVEREKLPMEGGRPSFTNAMSRSVTSGLPAGGTDNTTFVAEDAGWYWVLCGVPGHAIGGEWIGLKVDPAATGVSVKRKGG
jgi:Sulfocyanin (SoxE) domain